MTCIQRFSSTLDLNVHFHALVLDGVYFEEAPDRPRLLAAPPPTTDPTDDLQKVTDEVCRKVATHLGVAEDDSHDTAHTWLSAHSTAVWTCKRLGAFVAEYHKAAMPNKVLRFARTIR